MSSASHFLKRFNNRIIIIYIILSLLFVYVFRWLLSSVKVSLIKNTVSHMFYNLFYLKGMVLSLCNLLSSVNIGSLCLLWLCSKAGYVLKILYLKRVVVSRCCLIFFSRFRQSYCWISFLMLLKWSETKVKKWSEIEWKLLRSWSIWFFIAQAIFLLFFFPWERVDSIF